MPELPKVSQEFDADSGPFVAGIQNIIDSLEDFRSGIDVTMGKIGELKASIASIPNRVNIQVAYEQVGDMPDVMKNQTITQQIITNQVGNDGVSNSLNATADAAAAAAESSALLTAADAARSSGADAVADATNKAKDAEVDWTQVTLASVGATIAAARASDIYDEANKVLGGDLSKTTSATRAVSAATDDSFTLFERGASLWGLLTGHIKLFGGVLEDTALPNMIKSVGVIHLLADSAVEIGATLIPAAVAFTAFGIAAIPTLQDIYNHMTNLETVSHALGVQLYPLSNNFKDIAASVKPEVMTLFGEGLELLGRNSGPVSSALQAVGRTIDALGARFVVAINNGNGFASFLNKAKGDLSGWGDFLGNIGGIIGNVLKDMPGIAEIFLNIADNVTHFVEVITGAVGPVIEFLLAAHGIIVWGGLAVTAVVALAGPIVALVGVVGEAAAGLLGLGIAFQAVAADEGLMTAAMVLLEGTNPLGWIALLVGGITALVVAFGNSKSATTEWGDSIQKTLQNTQNLGSLGKELTGDLADASDRLSDSQAKLAGTQEYTTQVNLHSGQSMEVVTQAYKNQQGVVDQNRKVYEQLSGETNTYNSRVGDLANTYGGTTNALGLLNDAGITSSQILNSSGSQWQTIKVEVQGASDSFKAMGDGTGQASAALNALGNTFINQTLPAIQKVTQAEDQVIDTVIGSEQAFYGFQQAMGQVGTDAKATGASLNGLNANSLQLGSDFYSTAIPAAQKLFDSMLQGGANTAQLTAAVATSASQMLAYAGNNTTAKDVMVSMINNALGPGTVSFQGLNDWVKKNKESLGEFKSTVDLTTDSTSKLSNTIGGDLNNMMAEAIVQANGGQTAFTNFAKGVLDGQTHSDEFYKSGNDVIGMLLQQSNNNVPAAKLAFEQYAETGLHKTKTQADELWTDITKHLDPALSNIPKSETTKLIMSGQGSYTISPGHTVNVATGQVSALGGHTMAAGGLVTGGSGPKADDVPAWLSAREFVMNADAVNHYGPAFMAAINARKFADGGPVLEGNQQVISGTYSDDTFRPAFIKSMGAAMASQMIAAEKAAQAAAARAASSLGFVHPTGSGASVEALMESMAASIGWTGGQLADLLAVEEREAGFSLTARNASSGAYGLAQFINGPSEYAQYGGDVNTAGGQITAMFNYIRQRYGSPSGAEAHEANYGWYDQGGMLMPGYTMAYNGTGQPEKVTSPSGAGGSSTGDLHVHMNIDGKEFATAIYPGFQQTTYQKNVRNNGISGITGNVRPGAGSNQ